MTAFVVMGAGFAVFLRRSFLPRSVDCAVSSARLMDRAVLSTPTRRYDRHSRAPAGSMPTGHPFLVVDDPSPMVVLSPWPVCNDGVAR